ncbi:MAG: hypothetical protein DLM58_18295 [Pseudonocardiales bacterium]|nr:MAG: hypothetical protein DLM58_18295 [Pseudonocardiales bacterium]
MRFERREAPCAGCGARVFQTVVIETRTGRDQPQEPVHHPDGTPGDLWCRASANMRNASDIQVDAAANDPHGRKWPPESSSRTAEQSRPKRGVQQDTARRHGLIREYQRKRAAAASARSEWDQFLATAAANDPRASTAIHDVFDRVIQAETDEREARRAVFEDLCSTGRVPP